MPRHGLWAIAGWLAVLCLAGTAPAGAQSDSAPADDVFIVRAIEVDATAETAAVARAQAILDGERRAMRRLFERLTLSGDAPRLPRLNDRQIEALIRGLEFDKEKTSAVRYLAELTVAFKAEDVRRTLRGAGLGFAETRSKPAVVLPVLEDNGPPVLWEEPNPWRAAWAAQPPGDGLAPLVVPLGDLADMGDIDAEGALGGDVERLAALVRRYRIAGAALVLARLGRDADGKAAELQVDITRWNEVGGERAVADTFALAVTGRLEDTLAQGVKEATRRIEDLWKRDNLLRFDSIQRLVLSFPYGDLAEVVEARRRLAEAAGVRAVDLAEMTRKVARLSVTFVGEPQQLQLALAQKDMTLAPDPPDWILKLGAPRPGRPEAPVPGGEGEDPAKPPGSAARP